MEKDKRRGIVVIAYEELHKLLNLDDEHTILDITSGEKEREEEFIKIKLSGPTLHKTVPGWPIVYFSKDAAKNLLKSIRKK